MSLNNNEYPDQSPAPQLKLVDASLTIDRNRVQQLADELGISLEEASTIAMERGLALLLDNTIPDAEKLRVTNARYKSIARLAWQMKMAPEDCFDGLLGHAIRAADLHLSGAEEPPIKNPMVESFQITSTMDHMDFAQIEALQAAGGYAQQDLWAVHCQQ